MEDVKKAINILTERLFELRIISSSYNEFIKEIKSTLGDEELHTFDDISVRHNHHTLITISALDLLSICSLYNESTLFWQRSMLMKKGYLVIYESILEIEKRKKNLLNVINEYCNGDNQLFNGLNVEIKGFKKKYDYNKIKNIRNKISGHIDKDFDSYFDLLIKIDPENAITAVQAFLSILSKYDFFLNDLRLKINDSIVNATAKMERDIAKQKEKLVLLLASLKS